MNQVDKIIEDFKADIQFIKFFHRAWYTQAPISAYLRLGRYLPPSREQNAATICLASVEVLKEYQRQGLCKKLLSGLEALAKERKYHFMIESVLHDGLVNYLQNNGYVLHNLNYWKIL